MRGYHLFSYSDASDLMCAVPEDRPLPPFVRSPAWAYVREVEQDVLVQMSGGHARPVRSSLNGFYVFHLIDHAAAARRRFL